MGQFDNPAFGVLPDESPVFELVPKQRDLALPHVKDASVLTNGERAGHEDQPRVRYKVDFERWIAIGFASQGQPIQRHRSEPRRALPDGRPGRRLRSVQTQHWPSSTRRRPAQAATRNEQRRASSFWDATDISAWRVSIHGKAGSKAYWS